MMRVSTSGRASFGPVAALVWITGLPTLAHADEDPFVARQAIVRLQSGQSIAAINATFGTVTLDSISALNTFLVRTPLGRDEEQVVSDMDGDARIAEATLNYLGEETTGGGGTQSIFLRSTLDAYATQPSWDWIGLTPAQARVPARQITVAVLDTGIDATHPVFVGRLAPGARDFITNTSTFGDVASGLDSNGNGVPDQFVGHGTHIAGLVARVAPGAKILPLRVMDSDGRAALFDIVDAIYYAADNGASVINLSLGTLGEHDLLRNAVIYANSQGCTVVAAAGNEGNSSPIRYPAGWTDLGVVSVAACNASGVAPAFTSYGSHITLAAPGVAVTSATPGGEYGSANGSSYSAGVASGVIAALRAGCLETSGPQAVVLVRNTARNINALNPGREWQFGSGALDYQAATASSACQPICPADVTGSVDGSPDGGVVIEDLLAYLDVFSIGSEAADLTDGNNGGPDGGVSIEDLLYYLARFESGC